MTFGFDEQNKLVETVYVNLKQKFNTIATQGNKIAYTYREPISKGAQASSMFKSNLKASKIVTTLFQKMKIIQLNKQELIIEDYKENKVLCGIDLEK